MKKLILSLALATLLISCKEETKDKVQDATTAIGEDVEQKMDTLSAKTDKVIDTVQAKTGEALEKGAEKMDAAAEKLKEASKK